MNTKEEFRKLYILFLDALNFENNLKKFGVDIGESSVISSVYGMFDIAMTYLLNEKGLDILYSDILFTDCSLEDAMIQLNDYFL